MMMTKPTMMIMTTTMMRMIIMMRTDVREEATGDQGRKTATGEAVTTGETAAAETIEEMAEEADRTTTEVEIAGEVHQTESTIARTTREREATREARRRRARLRMRKEFSM